jgi:serine/threonine protein phosphatase PrpC
MDNLSSTHSPDNAHSILRDAIGHGDREVRALVTHTRRRAATTVVVALWRKDSEALHVASVGDSRAFIVRDRGLALLTEHAEDRILQEQDEQVLGFTLPSAIWALRTPAYT